MKVAELLRLLEQEGWELVRTRGSHRQSKDRSGMGRSRARKAALSTSGLEVIAHGPLA